MLLSYNELLDEIVKPGVITGVPDLAHVNGSSIDITLGPDLLIEGIPDVVCPKCGRQQDIHDKDLFAFKRGVSAHVFCQAVGCGFGGSLHSYIKPIDFSKKQPLRMKTYSCADGFTLWPGEVCLAHSVELFNLPHHITAEYRLKSSMARVFLEHLHAGWCDPGWNGSVLTLEFKNETQFHPLLLTAGMKCGQVCFYKHTEVPRDKSYAARGQYNHDTTATASKGMK